MKSKWNWLKSSSDTVKMFLDLQKYLIRDHQWNLFCLNLSSYYGGMTQEAMNFTFIFCASSMYLYKKGQNNLFRDMCVRTLRKHEFPCSSVFANIHLTITVNNPARRTISNFATNYYRFNRFNMAISIPKQYSKQIIIFV